MAVESWTSEGMDWNNPDPSNINYTIALYKALCERYDVKYSKYVTRLTPPKEKRRLSIDYLKDLRKFFYWLVDYGRGFKDLDKPPDYYHPSGIAVALPAIDCFSLSGINLELPPTGCLLNDERLVNFYKNMKKAICKLRYTENHWHTSEWGGANDDVYNNIIERKVICGYNKQAAYDRILCW